MNKKTKKILVIVGLSLLSVVVVIILVVSYFLNEAIIKPSNDAKADAKSRAAYLLQIPTKTNLETVGEAGMAESIDSNNRCYTYVFQGQADYQMTKNAAIALLSENGYISDQAATLDSENAYKVRAAASDGWSTQLQVLNNTSITSVAEGVIDNPVSTKPQAGQILISGQVCNI